ncbi:hypothetical protein D3C81_2311040 [compost metagenome]
MTIATGVSSLVKAAVSNGETRIKGESDNGLIRVELPDVKLWSPEQPHLYQVELTLYEGK